MFDQTWPIWVAVRRASMRQLASFDDPLHHPFRRDFWGASTSLRREAWEPWDPRNQSPCAMQVAPMIVGNHAMSVFPGESNTCLAKAPGPGAGQIYGWRRSRESSNEASLTLAARLVSPPPFSRSPTAHAECSRKFGLPSIACCTLPTYHPPDECVRFRSAPHWRRISPPHIGRPSRRSETDWPPSPELTLSAASPEAG